MQRHARKALDAGETSILSQGKPEEVTVPAIAKAAQAGDALAKRVLQDGIDALGFGLAQVMAIACPKRLVVGGGVSLLGEEIYLAPLRESVRRQTFAPYAHLVDLVGAELGEEVVLHGAVALAMLGRFQAG
jgi:glucokinase